MLLLYATSSVYRVHDTRVSTNVTVVSVCVSYFHICLAVCSLVDCILFLFLYFVLYFMLNIAKVLSGVYLRGVKNIYMYVYVWKGLTLTRRSSVAERPRDASCHCTACAVLISIPLKLYLVPFLRYSASKNGVTLKPEAGVVQGH